MVFLFAPEQSEIRRIDQRRLSESWIAVPFVSDYKVDLEKLEIKKTEKRAVKYTYICKTSFPGNRNRKGCFLKSHTGKQISMLQIIHNNYIICFLFG